MQQTFYIEPDEEIISVIGRLRKSGSGENFFVFPKRALVLQSIINLRLFQREAQKLSKKVVIVTQDEAGRALAEKAGMETEYYSDEFSRGRSHVELALHAPVQPPLASVSDVAEAERIAPRADMIGSSDFHAPVQPPLPAGMPPVAEDEADGRRLRVRNASPERRPGLNSVRHAEEAATRSMADMAPVQPPRRETSSAPSLSSHSQQPVSAAIPREERLRNFFADRTAAPVLPRPIAVSDRPPHIPIAPGRHTGAIFAFLGTVAFISVIGAGIALFLPEAVIHAIPYRIVQNADMRFSAVADGSVPSEIGETVSARIIEQDIDVSREASASGTSGAASSQKARGTVVIYNAYSKDEQPLVATTRFETADGKVYRLVKGVTVPGMSVLAGQDVPGAIEAEVVADQAGIEYNIGPAEFTIPGFKGGPKHAKFSAKSSKPFFGGGSASDGLTMISKEDLEKAESEAKEEAKARFLEKVSVELSGGERLLEESVEASVRAVSVPQAGTVASSFEYRGTVHVRAFTIPEDDIRSVIGKSAAREAAGIAFHPASVSLAYGDVSPDYDRQTVRFQARALITLESDIDAERFRSAVAGKDQSGIEQVMADFPGIKKISIDFSPEWFVSSVPDAEDRVTVEVGPGEE